MRNCRSGSGESSIPGTMLPGENGGLDIKLEVLRVLVQNKATKLVHGELRPGPDLSNIEGDKAKLV